MTTQTDFQKVVEFNVSFDFPVLSGLGVNTKVDELRVNLNTEELTELNEAYNANDTTEEMDATGDIKVVAYGQAYTYGINSDVIFETMGFKPNQGETMFQTFKRTYSNTTNETRATVLDKLNKLNQDVKHHTLVTKDKEKMSEALHRFILAVYEFEVLSNFDADYIFGVIHESNMSKLCVSEQEAQDTVSNYEKLYKEGTSPYDSPYYYPLGNGLYVVKNRSSGKALKSINYKPVKFNN